VIEEKINPDLLGGIIIRLGAKMIDSSLRTRLEKLHQNMKEAG
jgi:F-type H+-transporting ATPase subunit delta